MLVFLEKNRSESRQNNLQENLKVNQEDQILLHKYTAEFLY